PAATGKAPAPPPARPPSGPTPQRDRPCPSCAAPNAAKASACWACGALLHDVEVGVCPMCSAALWPRRDGVVDLSVCEGCGGVWLEPGPLGKLLLLPEEQKRPLLKEIRDTRTGSPLRVNPALV